MTSRVIAFAAALAFVVILTSATPSKLEAASRQSDAFVLAVTTSGPVSVTAVTNSTDKKKPSSGPRKSDMEDAPAPSAEAEEAIDDDEDMSDEKVSVIAYNIGGKAFGEFAADPIEHLVGETSTFEIEDAVIVGTDAKYVKAYRSHRYGLLGSTWGYDIPVKRPGMYDCTLRYAETYSEFFTEEPNRTFTVTVSGDASDKKEKAEFDVMVELKGAEFTAYDRTFRGIAVANTLSIRETPSIGDAFLSGISCAYVAPIKILV